MESSRVSSQLTTKHPVVLSQDQSLVSLATESSCTGSEQLYESAKNLSVSQAQELICQFFLDQLKQDSPDSALHEFKLLFIEPPDTVSSTPRQALDCIISSGSEQTFIYTLKRSIYILVNNWSATRQQTYIQKLVQLLSISLDKQKRCTVTLKRLTVWRRKFVKSQDYQELKLFASKAENRHQEHWSQRYRSYLLVSQSVDARKPLEQQEAARTYSKHLKEQFKLELAMYTARASSATYQQTTSPNPTVLGDEVLRLIQEILKKRSPFSYVSLARIFLGQTRHIRYKDFKKNILNYLLFALDEQDLADTIKTQLVSQLNTLYETYDDQPRTDCLLLRTCNWLIEYFTTLDRENPSLPFIWLTTQGNGLTLAILLLKIVLLCPQTTTNLECCLSQLIHYYKSKPRAECQWLIDFLEIVQVTLTVYAEDVRYNLVNVSGYKREDDRNDEGNSYRIFSQIKRKSGRYQRVA